MRRILTISLIYLSIVSVRAQESPTPCYKVADRIAAIAEQVAKIRDSGTSEEIAILGVRKLFEKTPDPGLEDVFIQIARNVYELPTYKDVNPAHMYNMIETAFCTGPDNANYRNPALAN